MNDYWVVMRWGFVNGLTNLLCACLLLSATTANCQLPPLTASELRIMAGAGFSEGEVVRELLARRVKATQTEIAALLKNPILKSWASFGRALDENVILVEEADKLASTEKESADRKKSTKAYIVELEAAKLRERQAISRQYYVEDQRQQEASLKQSRKDRIELIKAEITRNAKEIYNTRSFRRMSNGTYRPFTPSERERIINLGKRNRALEEELAELERLPN